jgi:4-hydroxy-tetrahydrodipicolinate reductase
VRIGVLGAGGRMGREVCRAVLARPGLELAAAVDPGFAGVELSELIGVDAGAMKITGEFDAMTAAGVEVAVDFTRIEAARVTLPFCAESGIHAVVGTTGLTTSDLDDLGHRFTGVGRAPNCVVAPNFAIGAVLMMRFAELAAPWFSGAEIIELHREGKLDAPSGTAMRTAEMIAGALRATEPAGGARDVAGDDGYPADRTVHRLVDGARGGAGPGGVRLHSVRLPGFVAHQEVVFGSDGQTLTIRHDSTDRASFMAGVMLAVESVPTRPGLTVGLEPLLGF